MQKRIVTDEGEAFYYLGYLTGEYLDRNVNLNRTAFDFEEEDTLFASVSERELIEIAKEGFPYSDEFEPNQWSNCTMEEVFERSTEDDLIAEITEECVKLYPENMGISGRELFGIEQYEEE